MSRNTQGLLCLACRLTVRSGHVQLLEIIPERRFWQAAFNTLLWKTEWKYHEYSSPPFRDELETSLVRMRLMKQTDAAQEFC